MSELQRQWAKNKRSNLVPFNEEDEKQDSLSTLSDLKHELPDDDSSSASSASSTGTIIPEVSRNLFARPNGTPKRKSSEQIPWTQYFERELFLQQTTEAGLVIDHHVYLTPPTNRAPLFVMHHGAGSSGLSFAALTSEMRKLLPEAGILSLDARGHGSTKTTHPGSTSGDLPPEDLSLSTLSSDLLFVIQKTAHERVWLTLPNIILVGHSLGGAVITDFVHNQSLGGLPEILGYAVLDVVEGSAMDALQSMQTYLSTRPVGFETLEQGIDWHIRTRAIRNSISARISVPALLKQNPTSSENTAMPWTWRTDLGATQPFWEGWFVGLSKKFLTGKGGKLLLLAGTDRLDTELTIGQMQGKYALQVFPEAGHFVHEDQPKKTASVLVDFYRRNDRSTLVLPPKVSEMIARGQRV